MAVVIFFATDFTSYCNFITEVVKMTDFFHVRTGSTVEFVDITDRIREIISRSEVTEGICTIFVPHTTAAVTINENADSNVVRDVIMELEKIVPARDNYTHAEGNSAAHIKSSLTGVSETLLVDNSRPVLGTWQSIYFCEYDGPRNRKVYVRISS